MRSKAEIEERVATLFEKHSIRSVPIPIQELAVAEGLPIIEQSLTSDVSGALIRSQGISAIAVNGTHSPNRRRFTIAHELAHHLLEHKGEEDHVDWEFTVIRRDGRSSEASVTEEIEANSLAANLLMPKRFIVQDFELQMASRSDGELPHDQLGALARKYQVSETAMKFRLINLGLISPI